MLAQIGRSHGLISDSVESAKAEFRSKISECRRELVEKYSGLDTMRREISDLAGVLADASTIFALSNDGAYEQAIAFYASQYTDDVNEGKANAEDMLALFAGHRQDLLNIQRDFTVDADWAKLEAVLSEFNRKLNLSDDGSSDQSAGVHLN